MRGTGANTVGTTPAQAIRIDTQGAQSVTLWLKNTGATALNHCTLYSKAHKTASKCLRNGAAAWTGAAFNLDGTAGNPSALAGGGEQELRFATNGAAEFEIWCGVAAGSTAVQAAWSTDYIG